jgi:hypothetical protein
MLSRSPKHSSNSEFGATQSRTISALEHEREQLIHRICLGIKRGLERGKPLRPLVRRCLRRHIGRSFKSDPKRKFDVCEATLIRAWYSWKRGGEVPCAVRRRYNAAGPSVPLWVFLHFAKFCARQPWPTMKIAFEEFCRRRGYAGRGARPTVKTVPLSYGMLVYHFPGKLFQDLQARMKAVETAQNDLAEFKLQLDAWLRARLPEKPQRRRRSGAELSLEAAAL